jgi:hypothetical protein
MAFWPRGIWVTSISVKSKLLELFVLLPAILLLTEMHCSNTVKLRALPANRDNYWQLHFAETPKSSVNRKVVGNRSTMQLIWSNGH